MSIQLSPTDRVVWSESGVEVLQPDGTRRTCRGKEELDLCWFEDAKQILDLANKLVAGWELTLIYAGEGSILNGNKLSVTYNPSTNILTANNQPCMGDGAAENITYLYLKEGCPRAFHIINKVKQMDVWCGRMWRAWSGQQGMAIKNFGFGDTLVWA